MNTALSTHEEETTPPNVENARTQLEYLYSILAINWAGKLRWVL
jgi:hypothetical protein